MRTVKDEHCDELIAQMPARIAKVRKKTYVDRSETCFKGKGTITTRDLNPDPELSYKLRVERRW